MEYETNLGVSIFNIVNFIELIVVIMYICVLPNVKIIVDSTSSSHIFISDLVVWVFRDGEQLVSTMNVSLLDMQSQGLYYIPHLYRYTFPDSFLTSVVYIPYT